jgi:7-cyano-7-deazaguanine synthase
MDGCVVLLSGGLDSATALALAVRSGLRAHALTIAYGQRHAIEVERAARIARSEGAASHHVVTMDLSFLGGCALTDRGIAVPKDRSETAIGEGIPVTYVPGRNLVFLGLACAWAESLEASQVWIGINAVDYSGYPDCRPEFLEAMERAVRSGTKAGHEGRPLRLVAPFAHLTKAEIVREAARLGVDFAATVSCYDPGPEGRPCRACDACLLRSRGFALAGIPDPAAP